MTVGTMYYDQSKRCSAKALAKHTSFYQPHPDSWLDVDIMIKNKNVKEEGRRVYDSDRLARAYPIIMKKHTSRRPQSAPSMIGWLWRVGDWLARYTTAILLMLMFHGHGVCMLDRFEFYMWWHGWCWWLIDDGATHFLTCIFDLLVQSKTRWFKPQASH